MATTFILLTILVFEFTAVVLLNRLRSDLLFGIITVNLIMIATFGSQLVSILGFVTNIGNVFYVTISLVLYILIENYGHQIANRAIWVSFSLIIVFFILTQLSINVPSIPETSTIQSALSTIFNVSPRIVLASLCAFLLAQQVNLYLYELLWKLSKGRLLWLRSNISNVVAQFIDSVIFFLVAFAITTPLSQIFGIMIVGFTTKVLAGLVATPFLYFALFNQLTYSKKNN